MTERLGDKLDCWLQVSEPSSCVSSLALLATLKYTIYFTLFFSTLDHKRWSLIAYVHCTHLTTSLHLEQRLGIRRACSI
jgi:hypothetical protein